MNRRAREPDDRRLRSGGRRDFVVDVTRLSHDERFHANRMSGCDQIIDDTVSDGVDG